MKKNTPTTKIIFILLLLFSLSLFSCKKDGSGNSVNGSDSSVSLLTKSRWTFIKFEYEKPDGTWVPDPDAADADQFTIGFNTDNTSLEIDLRSGDTTPSIWHFSVNNTILTIQGGYDVLSAAYNVNQLNTSTLVITNPNYRLSGYYVGERLTFTH